MTACEFCGYDTSGTEGFCPECGRPVHRFTDRARELVARANVAAGDESRRSRANTMRRAVLGFCFEPLLKPVPTRIEPVHILIALVDGPKGVGYHAIEHLGALPRLRSSLRLPLAARENPVRLPLAPAVERLIRVAVDEAAVLRHDWVGTEHLLLALCRLRSGLARKLLREAGVNHEAVTSFVKANLEAVRAADTNGAE